MVTTKDLRTAVTEGMRRQIVFATTDILFFFLWNININYICKKKSLSNLQMRPNLQNRFTTKTPGFLASQRHNKNSFPMTVRFHYSPVCCALKIGGTFLGKVPFTSRFLNLLLASTVC